MSQASKNVPLACLVLAAGKGTRMNSNRSKVLHELAGLPLVAYPVRRARELGAAPVVAVLGHQRKEVEATLGRLFGGGGVTVVEQTEQRGTGHAVKLGLGGLEGFAGVVLILYGDVPLLRRSTLGALVDLAKEKGSLAMLTAKPRDPSGYGRVVRDESGHVLRVVEDKDASDTERRIGEVNAGIYAAPVAFLRQATAALEPKNAQGEYYLTDVVAAAATSIGVDTIVADADEVSGINDRRQLAEAEERFRERQIERHIVQVTFRDPRSVSIEEDVEIGQDAVIGRNVALRGQTRIAAGAVIGDGVILTDTVVGEGAQIEPYTVSNQAVIGPACQVGPFARLRPQAELGPDVHVGNFVEIKKTKVGRGSKANHLSYLGDAVIGEKVNVGAGTITCNYNGYEKQQTVIDDGAFIGSDTQLVAPVRVGREAVVGAGTTVVRDVPPGALAVSRVEQKHVEGYTEKLRARYPNKKK